MLYDKLQKLTEKRRLMEEKRQRSLEMLNTSAGAEMNDEPILTRFFNNCTMAKILDLILENPKIPIYTKDIIDKTGISRKSVQYNFNLLKAYGMLNYTVMGKRKFYTWNFNNTEAKHISKLRRILNNNNVKLSE